MSSSIKGERHCRSASTSWLTFLFSDSILDVLSSISEYAPRFVSAQTLPLLFSSLPDQAPSRQSIPERTKIWQTLNALQSLCIQQELFESLVIRLTTKLDLLCFPTSEQAQVVARDSEPTAAYAHMILKTLAQALVTKVKKGHLDISKYIDRLVPSLFNLFVESEYLSSEKVMIATEPRLIEVAAEIITLVVQSLPVQFVDSRSSIQATFHLLLCFQETAVIFSGIIKSHYHRGFQRYRTRFPADGQRS